MISNLYFSVSIRFLCAASGEIKMFINKNYVSTWTW